MSTFSRQRPLMMLAATSLLMASATAAGQAISVGARKQLFLDARFIARSEGVRLVVNPPIKHGLVLHGTNRWENGLIFGASSVFEDKGKFRLWYTATGVPRAGKIIATDYYNLHLCYAESDDGTHWTKPNLGLYQWEGSTANNILMDAPMEVGGGVFVDPVAPPEQRYKLIGRLHNPDPRWPAGSGPEGVGIYVYTSADGLNWHLQPKRLYPFDADAINTGFYDASKGRYRAYVRIWIDDRRRVGVVDMADILQPWPYDKGVPVPAGHHRMGVTYAASTEIPEAFGPGSDDRTDVDYYCSAVVKYPWADDAYLMFPSAYRHFPRPPEGKYGNDGVLDVTLATSRTGLKFTAVSHSPYIGRGLPGERDSSQMYMTVGMIRRGNEIYQYYGGLDYTHGVDVWLPEMKDHGGLIQVRQRLDGFVAVEAGEEGGQFETPLLVFAGRKLELNLDVAAAGEVRVELRELGDKVIDGFSFADSDPLFANDVARTVTWRHGNSDVSQLAGREIRVAFRLRTGRLFAFQFVE